MKTFKLYDNVSQRKKLTECNNNNDKTNGNETNAMFQNHSDTSTTKNTDEHKITNSDIKNSDKRFSIENFLTTNVPNAVAETVRNGLLNAQQYPSLNMLTPCLKDMLLAAQLFRGKLVLKKKFNL